MPTHMIHLAVANSLNSQLLGIRSSAQFYLGSISPDTIGIASIDKAKTHLSHKKVTFDKLSIEDIQFLKNHVIEFIQNHSSYKGYSFFLGYGVHVLTDIYWSEVSINFQQKYSNDKTPLQERKAAYYNDLDYFDFMMYQNAKWRNEIWVMLKNVQALDVDDILEATEIERWKQCVLNWFEHGRHYENPPKYLTQDDISNFIDVATEEIIEIRDCLKETKYL